VTLDNGITVGTRIELEAEEDDDQIDAAYVYFKGGFGDIRIGSQGQAADSMMMLPPGSSTNFGPYSPATNSSNINTSGFDPSGVSKPQSIVYYSPTWSGFSFGVSYAPEGSFETQSDGAADTFHPSRAGGDLGHNMELGLHYDYEGDGWGLALGGSLAYAGDIEEHGNADRTAFNVGANLSFGGLSVGTAFAMTDAERFTSDSESNSADSWAVGAGLSYNVDAWTVGAGWALMHREDAAGGTDTNQELDVQRLGITGSYAMGPGIDLDAGLIYSFTSDADDSLDAQDDYDSLEFSIGSSITF
jgi:predicted porin